MTPAKEHYAIVGGGMLGLALAWRLSGMGHRVTVLEAADHLGGLADAWRLGDITWDRTTTSRSSPTVTCGRFSKS